MQRDSIYPTQFSPLVTFCKTVVHCHYQYIDMVKIQNFSVTMRIPHIALSQSSLFPSCLYSSSPWEPLISSPFLQFVISKMLHKWSHTKCTLLGLVFFLFFHFFLMVQMQHSFLMQHSFNCSSIEGHLGCFQLGAIRSKADINVYVQVFVWA